MNAPEEAPIQAFDFARHEEAAIAAYLRVQVFYQDLAIAAKRIADEALKRRGIQVHSIEARAKDATSFGRKAAKPSKHDPNKPRYDDPLKQITDLAAIRLITFFPRTIEAIDEMLNAEFEVLEQFDKGEALVEEERFGYKSVHYLVTLNAARVALPEYERFRGAVIEVQVRTILQHAWAEIEHDIQYKSTAAIPRDIRRRFMALAGLLEIADREFQAIQDADRDLTEKAVDLVNAGQLDRVEVTPGALKTYLDRKLGPDGRMSDFSYDWTVRLLRKLGFTNLAQVEACIQPYDHDRVSRLVHGSRQGQLTRFEAMIMAGLGEKFIERHLYAAEDWFGPGAHRALGVLAQSGVQIARYDPIEGAAPAAAAGGALYLPEDRS